MSTYTRKANGTLVLMLVGSTKESADDEHLTIGRGKAGSSHENYVSRAEVSFPEPTWPSAGKLVHATLTVQESGTGSHDDWRGGSPGLAIYRLKQKPKLTAPTGFDGHGSDDYTSGGSGDHYPGSQVDTTPALVSIHGKTSKDVTSMLESTLPPHILKRNGDPCGDELYGYYQFRSTDESSGVRSMVLSQTMYLTVEIDTRVTPGTPEVLEVIGAVEGSTDPVLVATTTGHELAVRFGFAAGPNDKAAQAQLDLYGAGATDLALGTRVATSGNVAPERAAGTNVYIARLSGLAVGVIGKWVLTVTSTSGLQSPPTSVETDTAYIQTAVIPGPPLAVKVSPYVSDVHVYGSLNGPGTITAARAVMYRRPQGTLVFDDGPDGQAIGGTRSVDLDYGERTDIAPGQVVSVVLSLRNQDGIWSAPSAPVIQTMIAIDDTLPVLTPLSGRLLDVTPTFTITGPLFDGWRAQVIHETDETIILYSTGDNVVVDQTTVNFTVPAGKLAYGQHFRVQIATVPNGGGTTYGEWTEPQLYSIAGLATATLSVPAAINGKVGTQTPSWHRVIRDPDGADPVTQIVEVFPGADPSVVTGFLVRQVNFAPQIADAPLTGLTIPWETSVHARMWVRNDITALAGTTAVSGGGVGSTALTVASTANFTVGQRFTITSGTVGHSEERVISTLPGGNVITFGTPFVYAHLAGENVAQYVPGPFSPWVVIKAEQPPDVDLLSPGIGVGITRPWTTIDWVTTPYGGRTQARAIVSLYHYTGAGVNLGLVAYLVVGTETRVDIPAYLLESQPAVVYGWDVTVTDTDGMTTTSVRHFFYTDFATPEPVVSVTALADPTVSGVVVSWEPTTDPDLHHYEVVWFDDAGEPVRIDGGPEALNDGRTPLLLPSLTHIGARLGTNTYAVRTHNGWRASEPVNATEELTWSNVGRGTWEMVDATGEVSPLRVDSASGNLTQMLDPQQPPGAANRALAWGLGARTLSLTVTLLPDEPVTTTLRLLMADPSRGRTASPVWIKAPAGYGQDPVWAVLTSFSPTPAAGGLLSVSMDWLEVGDPAHSILPVPPPPVPEALPSLLVSPAEYDFGTVLTS